MACTRPIRGYRTSGGRVSFVRPWRQTDGIKTDLIEVPCGQCIKCRLERSRQWAMRIMHEATLQPNNSFITLTYDDEHLPEDRSLNKRDWQLFAKRMRKHIGEFRFFHCGEYGERTSRPHYHAIIFGQDFKTDREAWGEREPHQLYVSPMLNWLWKKGNCWIGDVTFESAAYVARYALKKAHGSKAAAEYTHVDYATGEVFDRLPEYATMSRGEGIGKQWYEKWKGDVYPSDEVIVRGKAVKPPKFYDEQLKKEDEKLLEKIKQQRQELAERNPGERTFDREKTKERHAELKATRFQREPEEKLL